MENTLVTDQIPEKEETKEVNLPTAKSQKEESAASSDEPTDETIVTDPGDDLPTNEEVKEYKESELTEAEKLLQKRTGYWPVHLDPVDIKWVKNACNNKFEFTGPNEAYMLMNCFVGFSSAVERDKADSENKEPAVLPASSIEACAFFINRYSASGIDAAQRSFRIAMALNPIIMQMKELDSAIDAARKAEEEARIEKPVSADGSSLKEAIEKSSPAQ